VATSVAASVTASVTMAVKNGPPGMWRALGAPDPVKPIDRFVTAPLWLAAAICIYLALAVIVSRQTRRGTVRPDRTLVATTAVLGLLVVVELLVRSAALGLLVLVLLVAALVSVLLRAGLHRAHKHARRTTEAIDLARWRDGKGARRRAGSR
jgi:O-antigen/teichoic acid export membrane protein